MVAVEIILIIIGVLFIIGSFFIHEKLTDNDIERISDMSEAQLSVIVERQLKNADSKVEDAIDELIDEKMAESKRVMERTCNEKIMAINEYSDTVLDAINKSHNEIMFLYSMLNDKHKELTGLAGELQEFSMTMKNTESEVMQKITVAMSEVEQRVEEAEPVPENEFLKAAVLPSGSEERNHNDDILFLHNAGKSDVDIAKELGLGLGEVKLVIGLFDEGKSSEI